MRVQHAGRGEMSMYKCGEGVWIDPAIYMHERTTATWWPQARRRVGLGQ